MLDVPSGVLHCLVECDFRLSAGTVSYLLLGPYRVFDDTPWFKMTSAMEHRKL